MSYSSHEKMFKQLAVKPAKMNKFIKHNAPKDRGIGINTKRCRHCGRTGAHISAYGLKLCRQCFRDIATKIGFKKYS